MLLNVDMSITAIITQQFTNEKRTLFQISPMNGYLFKKLCAFYKKKKWRGRDNLFMLKQVMKLPYLVIKKNYALFFFLQSIILSNMSIILNKTKINI